MFDSLRKKRKIADELIPMIAAVEAMENEPEEESKSEESETIDFSSCLAEFPV